MRLRLDGFLVSFFFFLHSSKPVFFSELFPAAKGQNIGGGGGRGGVVLISFCGLIYLHH